MILIKRLAFAFVALVAGVHLAQAQTPVMRIIVPFAPGGGQDVLARVIAPELATLLGETLPEHGSARRHSGCGSRCRGRGGNACEHRSRIGD